ncbi:MULTISPECIES: CvpA family protein [Methylosinus]|uniref:Colicin V synthesis protein n=1 Tax=Methylosinus trichosporium (strain ATCC 35070 / NCIMB 11131 / UNIQEM 75 / OB3b) TaxID=595536 RepID=A0A2D2CWJ4_METT3|nr:MULTISPECIES: CvpA family protein [Methylosinus]ATQ67100.1 colicin V synthesis protein [Methylosinus trichosporium OB3b]OBS52743.1 colicin V synthesis protein [Methylosinus sp. 3S-1]
MPSYLDLTVTIIVLVSGLLALLRGFTREVLAVLSWVAAAAAAYYLHPLVVPYVKPYVPKDNLAVYAGAAVVFFATLIVVSLVTVKLSDLILDSKIGALDRTLGFLFGAARGLLLAVVAFLFYDWLVPEASQPDWVKTARTKPVLQASGDRLREFLPDDIDGIVAKLKTKKGGGSEEPPAEQDNDAGRPSDSGEATADKRTELTNPHAGATYGANDQQKLDALAAGRKLR